MENMKEIEEASKLRSEMLRKHPLIAISPIIALFALMLLVVVVEQV